MEGNQHLHHHLRRLCHQFHHFLMGGSRWILGRLVKEVLWLDVILGPLVLVKPRGKVSGHLIFHG